MSFTLSPALPVSGATRLEIDLGWLRSLGWSADELLCGGLQVLMHPDDEARALDEIEDTLTSGYATALALDGEEKLEVKDLFTQ
mgnify:CR=1 FL=1